jgi:hypothetical protein
MATKPQPSELIKLTFLALSRDFPERVKLKEHSLEYSEAAAIGNLVSAVYGANSKQMALVVAAQWTATNRDRRTGPNQVLYVDASYRADLLIDSADQMKAGVSGWLHLDRMSAELRDNLKQLWLSWIQVDHGAARASRLTDSSLSDIALEYPGYIRKMMALRSPRLTAVVHPVRPRLDPGAVLWVATVRYDKDRFVNPLVRFLPQIAVEV